MGKVLIIGGGISGIQAALRLSQLGIENVLVEREKEVGGTVKVLGRLFPEGKWAPTLLADTIKELTSHGKTAILTQAELFALSGTSPHFKVTLTTPKGEKKMEAAALIVATGFKPFDPHAMKHYGVTKSSDVITALELTRMLREGKLERGSDGRAPASITFIQCIGSRDTHAHTYCSYFCCMYAVELASLIKETYPGIVVNVLYMDMRTPFCSELSYEEARARGVRFYRSKPARIRTVKDQGHLLIQFEDTLDTKLRFLPSEMVVLCIGASPAEGTEKLASLLNIDCEESGFFKWEHSPVGTHTKGIFLAGAASGPKDVPSCLAEGAAAAAQAAIALKG